MFAKCTAVQENDISLTEQVFVRYVYTSKCGLTLALIHAIIEGN